MKYFLYIAIAFVAVLMASDTVATKIVQLGPLSLAGAIFVFPISYIFGDILTEVYGYKATRRIIWSGFAALLFMSAVYWLVQILPAATFWGNQEAYEKILGAVPRVVIGSIAGYWAGEFLNSYVLSKMKIWTGGRLLWTRTIGSTIAGEAADSLLFGLIAFYHVLPSSGLVSVIISGYIAKVLIEIAATPLTYLAVNHLKKAEGLDAFDRDVNYNPFAAG